MPRLFPFIGVTAIATLLVGGPLWYLREHERHYRNFHVVDDGVLYRSAQLDLDGLKHVVREYGIRTIVDLRDGETSADRAEESWANAVGVKHVRITPRAWWTGDGQWPVPAEVGLSEFRKIMDDPRNHPVLVHCFGGIHRTGLYCAIYRMDFQHWKKPEAIAEMRAFGYTILDEHLDVVAFLDRYEPKPRCCYMGSAAPGYLPPMPPFVLTPELEALEKAAAEQAIRPAGHQIAPAP